MCGSSMASVPWDDLAEVEGGAASHVAVESIQDRPKARAGERLMAWLSDIRAGGRSGREEDVAGGPPSPILEIALPAEA